MANKQQVTKASLDAICTEDGSPIKNYFAGTPAKGKRLRDRKTGKVFEGAVYLAPGAKQSDFEEITEATYKKAIAKEASVSLQDERSEKPSV